MRRFNNYRYNAYVSQILSFFKRNTILSQLILINIVVFLIINFTNLLFWLFQIQPNNALGISTLIYWLSVPSDLHLLVQRPWSIFTYMFSHENFFHLFFNMLVLYFSGKIFLEYLSKKQLFNTYITGGIIGAAFYIVSFNIFPVFQGSVNLSIAIGASASVLAILVAIATYIPDYSVILMFFGKVKLKHLAIILVVIDVLSIRSGNPGGHIAHLGGALWGYLSIVFLRKGFNNIFTFKGLHLEKFLSIFTKKKTSYSTYNKRSVSDEDYNRKKVKNQKRVDKILEKISKSGYQSLSKEEKELLFKISNKNKH